MAFVCERSIESVDGAEDAVQCTIKYDINYFSDDLYTFYNVDYPPNIAKAVKKRKAEYLAARIAAKYAILKLKPNGDNFQVRNADPPQRFPIWPEGVWGSISHCADRAFVMVSTRPLAIGVDVESIDLDTVNTIKCALKEICPGEIEQNIIGTDATLVLAFSSKESLYKALYPQVRYMFGFECAELVNITASTFKLRLTKDLTQSLPKGAEFSGHYSVLNDKYIKSYIIYRQTSII